MSVESGHCRQYAITCLQVPQVQLLETDKVTLEGMWDALIGSISSLLDVIITRLLVQLTRHPQTADILEPCA